MEQKGSVWKGGRILDPEVGKNYNAGLNWMVIYWKFVDISECLHLDELKNGTA